MKPSSTGSTIWTGGYEKLEEKLRGVGADIVRIKEPDQTDTPPKKAA